MDVTSYQDGKNTTCETLIAQQSTTYDWSQWPVFSAYIALGLVATLGNAFIIYVIWKRRMRSSTFWLVGNQALSDLACGILYLNVWAACSSAVVAQSVLTCEIVYTIKVSTFFVSVFTMAAISIERYLKLYYPHNNSFKPRISITLAWIGGILTSIFAMFKFRASEFFTFERLVGCRWGYKTTEIVDIYFFKHHYNMLVLILVGLGIPITITAYCYFKVVQKLKERKVGATSVNAEAKERQRRNTTRMLIFTVLCYFLLCSPIYLIFVTDYFVVRILPDECNASTQEPLYFLLAYFLCVFSICINPVIYCHYNKEFKSEAKNLVHMFFAQKYSSEASEGAIRNISTSPSSKSAEPSPIALSKSV